MAWAATSCRQCRIPRSSARRWRTGPSPSRRTKLNRPTRPSARVAPPAHARPHRDRPQAGGDQFVSVEDTVCAVHASHGRWPACRMLRSEVAIVCGLAAATLGTAARAGDRRERGQGWTGMRAPRTTTSSATTSRHVCRLPGLQRAGPAARRFRLPALAPGLAHVSQPDEAVAADGQRVGMAAVSARPAVAADGPQPRQFNTTIYGLDDRYRGIRGGRRVVFVNPDDLAERGLPDGATIDVIGEWDDGAHRQRRLPGRLLPDGARLRSGVLPGGESLVPLERRRIAATPRHPRRSWSGSPCTGTMHRRR